MVPGGGPAAAVINRAEQTIRLKAGSYWVFVRQAGELVEMRHVSVPWGGASSLFLYQASPTSNELQANLQSRWQRIRRPRDGNKSAAVRLAALDWLEFRGTTVTGGALRQPEQIMQYRLTALPRPAKIEATFADGHKEQGIVEVGGDIMSIIIARPDQPLPVDWRSEGILLDFRRAPPSQAIDPGLLAFPFSAEEARQFQEGWAKYLQQPVEISNSLGMKLRLVPPGEFDMGLSDDDATRLMQLGQNLNMAKALAKSISEMQPRHRVRLTQPFWIGSHEVTVGQFRAFVEATGYVTDAEREGHGAGWLAGTVVPRKEFTWRTPGFADFHNEQPVTLVSWNDAQAFVKWLETMAGRGYRLPTEAEWEFACRAGTDSCFHTGPRLTPEQANRGWKHRHPVAVGSFPANAFGLFDMHGNVAEWCADAFESNYYAGSETENPRVLHGLFRVQRGGAFDTEELRCASAFRFHNAPKTALQMVGFRVVLVSPPSR